MQVELLCRKRSRFIWRLLRKMRISETRIEDALQELLIVLFRRLRAFDSRQPICTWIFATAYRVAYECWRSSPHAEESALSSAELAEQAEALYTVFEWLERLDEDKRAVAANSHAFAGRGPRYVQGVPFVASVGRQPKRGSFPD
jgi:RNA polymerase sigma factor (sigma-70 family)